jgi:hypothetical protein
LPFPAEGLARTAWTDGVWPGIAVIGFLSSVSASIQEPSHLGRPYVSPVGSDNRRGQHPARQTPRSRAAGQGSGSLLTDLASIMVGEDDQALQAGRPLVSLKPTR